VLGKNIRDLGEMVVSTSSRVAIIHHL